MNADSAASVASANKMEPQLVRGKSVFELLTVLVWTSAVSSRQNSFELTLRSLRRTTMDQPTAASGTLVYLAEQSRAGRWAGDCFKAAIFLRMFQPLVVLGVATSVILLSTVCP